MHLNINQPEFQKGIHKGALHHCTRRKTQGNLRDNYGGTKCASNLWAPTSHEMWSNQLRKESRARCPLLFMWRTRRLSGVFKWERRDPAEHNNELTIGQFAAFSWRRRTKKGHKSLSCAQKSDLSGAKWSKRTKRPVGANEHRKLHLGHFSVCDNGSCVS